MTSSDAGRCRMDGAISALAERAGQLLTTEIGREVFRTIAALGLIREGPVKPQAHRRWQVGPFVEAGGEVLRRLGSSDINPLWWADVAAIPLRKQEGRRCVLLGESVARGFFFDPLYTPASMLSAALSRRSGEVYEVVDLAATNATLPELITLLDEIERLAPDVVVVWAGNNWSGLSQIAASPGMALLARNCEDYAELSAHVKRAINDEFCRFAEQLRHLVDAGVEMTVVVPAVNRDTWARDSLYGGAYSNHGVEGHERNNSEEFHVAPPGCSPYIQDLLRSLSRSGIGVVDLPQAIADSELAGRPDDLFLDYCHHNWSGLVFAVDAIAGVVLGEHVASTQEVDTRHEATAYALAAVHADAWSQDERQVRKLLSKAQSLWPPALDIVDRYMSMSLCSGRVGWQRFCKEAEAVGGQQVVRYFGSGAPGLSLRPALRRALRAVQRRTLTADGSRPPWDAELLERLYLHPGSSCDLLERPFSTPHAKSLHLLEQCVHLRCRAVSQRFSFLLRRAGTVQIRLTYRTLESEGVRLAVNGAHALDLPRAEEWRTERFCVSLVDPGLHELELSWARPSTNALNAIREFADVALRGNPFATPLPIRGEVSVLEATLEQRSEA